MGNWFGSLDLAYKYTVVFASLLAITMAAGLVKVFFDRRKLKKFAEQKQEAPVEERMELNHREKDEGDLFGIRALEAGYFAGIPQSRPTSRAASPAGAMMSTSTLVGGFNSPKLISHSMASSVTSLPLAHTREYNRDSDTLPGAPRRASPPQSKLLPSEAELHGRHKLDPAVNMSLDVPPSPVFAQDRFSGSDDDDSVRNTYKSEHYAPVPPHLPVKNNLRVAVQPPNPHMSHAASLNDPSPIQSPNLNGPPSPNNRPLSYVPSMPDRRRGDERQAQMPAHHEPEQSLKPVTEQATPIILLPQTYQPIHQRDMSNASSMYSDKRNSTTSPRHERNFSLPKNTQRDSVIVEASKETLQTSQPKATLAAPDAANDPRFSEFYDAYFRNSKLNFGLGQNLDRQSVIPEDAPASLESQPPKAGMAL